MEAKDARKELYTRIISSKIHVTVLMTSYIDSINQGVLTICVSNQYPEICLRYEQTSNRALHMLRCFRF